jgi:hypothetical protein
MQKRISSKAKRKKKRAPQEDVNQFAHRLGQQSVAEQGREPDTITKAQISQLMSQMGRKGGKIGGKRRMETMTSEERSQVALKAAKARWAKGIAKPQL